MALRPIVLVGAGHAHLELVRSADRFREAGAALILVDPGDFHYSGQASATLGGNLSPAQNRIDVGRLALAYGIEHVRARACGLDRTAGSVLLSEGLGLPYTLVSFDVGSVAAGQWKKSDRLVPVKPITALERLKDAIEAGSRDRVRRIVIAGGGPTGVEIAGNLLRLSTDLTHPLEIVLVGSKGRLLPAAPSRAGRIAEANLKGRGARLLLDARVESFDGESVRLSNGERLPADRLVAATGLVADPLMAQLGLPVAASGGLAVAATLHSIADPAVFAIGDCAGIEGHDLPKIGVYAVRAAPVLIDNLLASLRGAPLRPFRPQRHYLSILDLGDGTGLAIRAGLALHGRAMLRWKRRIDRRFLDRFR